MERSIRLVSLADIPVGGGVTISREVTGTADDIAVLRDDDGSVHALDDTCTHSLASLAKGWVTDGYVECPLHGARFDLRTGQEMSSPPLPSTRTHRIVIRDEAVFLVPGAPANAREADDQTTNKDSER